MVKRLLSMVSALVLSLSSLFVFAPMIASAAVDACTWTGGGADANWSTAGNWSCATDTGQAPAAGDSLVFPYGASAARFASNNDLTAGTSFTTITFSGTKGGSDSNYTLAGNAIQLTSGISNTSVSAYDTVINLPITAGGDLTFAVGGGLDFGASDVTNKTIALGSHSLAISGTGFTYFYGPITGSGNITANSGIDLEGDNSGYTGTLTSNAYAYLYKYDFGGTFVVADDSTLSVYICDGSTLTANITVNSPAQTGDSQLNIYHITCPPPTDGGGYGGGGCDDATSFIPCAVNPDEYFYGGYVPTTGSVTLDGTLTLGADVVISSGAKNVAIKSAISGSHTIGLLEGGNGILSLQGVTNTSKTANATINPVRRTKTIAAGDESTAVVNVTGYATYTVNGKRGDIYVQGGAILHGSGTVGKLKVDDESIVGPGNSPGCLNSGDLTLQGAYEFELGGADPCTGYDQLKVTGAVNVTNGSVTVSTYGNYKAKAGSKYVIIANDGSDAVTGTFKNVAEGATFKSNGYVLRVSYKGGDGNDVQLTVVSVPGTPDTGLALITNNPIATLAGATLAAGAILVISRRMKPATKRVRR